MGSEIEAEQKRQCWECLQRRLVCDFTRPACKKCIRRGKDCPGYDGKKPLKWVEHGKGTSKHRQRRNCPKKDSEERQNATHTAAVQCPVTNDEISPITLLADEVSPVTLSADEAYYEDFEVAFNPTFELFDETADIVRTINYCKWIAELLSLLS